MWKPNISACWKIISKAAISASAIAGRSRRALRFRRAPRNIDGLVLLGAGPKGIVSGNLIPSLGAELRLTRDFLDRGLPVIGIGIGACMLSTRGWWRGRGGAAALYASKMPGASFPTRSAGICRKLFRSPSICAIVRFFPATPKSWRSAATSEPVLFQIRDNCFGFVGHPGIKSAMIEDLIMEFDEVPEGTAETLAALARGAGRNRGGLGRDHGRLDRGNPFDGAISAVAARRGHIQFF